MRRIIFLAIMVGCLLCAATFIVATTNYINDQNKITGDLINTTIRVDSYEGQTDPYGFAYFSVVDKQNRGYYTQIGSGILPRIKVGHEYYIVYFCDTNNIRRIVSIIPNDPEIHKCTVGECTK